MINISRCDHFRHHTHTHHTSCCVRILLCSPHGGKFHQGQQQICCAAYMMVVAMMAPFRNSITLFAIFSFYSLSTNTLFRSLPKSKLMELLRFEVQTCFPEATLVSNGLWETSSSVDLRRSASIQEVYEVLANGEDLTSFIASVEKVMLDIHDWSLDYECATPHWCRMKPIPGKGKAKFSSKAVCYLIAQHISSRPSLHPELASHRLRILETSNMFYLTSERDNSAQVDCRTPAERLLWAKRPFEFSAALDVDIAVAIRNILKARILRRRAAKNNVEANGSEQQGSTPITMLDPCCGSGTNLFVWR